MPASPYKKVRGVLLDIEGTTSPVSFVYDVLFPYARGRLSPFLLVNSHLPEVRTELQELQRQNAIDVQEGAPVMMNGSDAGMVQSGAAYCLWLMDRDRKTAPLKAIQGMIWQNGYQAGELHGDVFEDVPRAFSRWHESGTTLSIFSSGSTLAQKLLFRHTSSGDLTRYIGFYFDTRTGPKQARESYQRIAAEIQQHPGEILFVSDVTAELAAARDAGLQTALAVRPGNAEGKSREHPTIHSFDELTLN